MWRASGLVALVALVGVAHAEPGPRAALAEQLAAELDTIDKALANVGDKLASVEAARLRRVRAAYRILRAPLTGDASAADRMALARRRAAARMLLERERHERALLAREASLLREARAITVGASGDLDSITLPRSLRAPVRGTIVRRFGTLFHERARVTLARRGIDFDVEPLTAAVAPEAGVVRYAGPIRGLDHGVVLDHGTYYTVIAKLAEPAIPVGTHVDRGDRLGRAARHRVYLEVRVRLAPGGLPIDPEPLLARR